MHRLAAILIALCALIGAPQSAMARTVSSGKTASGNFSATTSLHARPESPQVLDRVPETPPRDYEPASGRAKWPSRDPIGENGGENLYRSMMNDPVNWVDRLGLDIVENRRPARNWAGAIADHFEVEIDTAAYDPSRPSAPTSAHANSEMGSPTTVTDRITKLSADPTQGLKENQRIAATTEEGAAVTEAAKSYLTDKIRKPYQWPNNDCGETFGHVKRILENYSKMARNDFRDKYGLPPDPTHPPKSPPPPPRLDGIDGSFNGVIQGP